MAQARVKTCRSCGADIYWVTTTQGNRMPVDAAPVPDGEALLFWRQNKLRAYILTASEEVAPDRNRYASHFRTCPDAARWRR